MSATALLVLIVVVTIVLLVVIVVRARDRLSRTGHSDTGEQRDAPIDDQSHTGRGATDIEAFQTLDVAETSSVPQAEGLPQVRGGHRDATTTEVTAASISPASQQPETEIQLPQEPAQDLPLATRAADDESESGEDDSEESHELPSNRRHDALPPPVVQTTEDDLGEGLAEESSSEESEHSLPESEIQLPEQLAKDLPSAAQATNDESESSEDDSEESHEQPSNRRHDALPPPVVQTTEDDLDEGLVDEDADEDLALDDLDGGLADDESKQEDELKTNQPRKYKGLKRAKPGLETAEKRPKTVSDPSPPVARSRSMPIEVRLRFDRGGFCSVSLIAKRSAEMPETVSVMENDDEIDLQAMQDEWFQDIVTEQLSKTMIEGIVWTSKDGETSSSWTLSGRELYVLAPRGDISGFVSNPCLVIRQKHVVLCTERLRTAVEQALHVTGSEVGVPLDHSFGLPNGWILFQDIVPNLSVEPSNEADILNALRPLPEIEINLEEGLVLERATWLEGYPPHIRVFGGEVGDDEVRIDGHVAHLASDGCYRATGWDFVGDHAVWCGGKTRSYSIVPFTSSCDWWDAYRFKVDVDSDQELTICGPLVTLAPADQDDPLPSVTVPETNTVILGRNPGERAIATNVSHAIRSSCIAAVDFKPVWALPLDPLHCDKSKVRVIFLGEDAIEYQPAELGLNSQRRPDSQIGTWSRSILDACRKGMGTNPESEPVQRLWRSYRSVARQAWRARR